MSNFVIGLLTAALLLGNSFKPSFISPDIRLGFSDLAVIIIWITAIITRRRQLFASARTSPLFKPIVTFIGVGLLSLLLVGRQYGSIPFLVGLLYLVRWEFYALFFLPLSVLLIPDRAVKLLRYLGLALVITGIAQYIFMPDIRSLSISDWDPHYYRVVGTLLDPGFVGILLIFSLLIFTPEGGPLPLFHSALWAVSYTALALTYSRSSFLAFIAGFISVGSSRKSRRFLLSTLLLISVTLLILPRTPDGEGVKLERTSSLKARLDNWGYSLTIFKDHPILGVGFNTYRYAQKSYGFLTGPNWQVSHGGAGADSSLLFVAATTGLIGLAAYLWYLSRLWAISSTSWAFRAGLVALFIHSWFLNSLFYPWVMIWLAVWVTSVLRVESHH